MYILDVGSIIISAYSAQAPLPSAAVARKYQVFERLAAFLEAFTVPLLLTVTRLSYAEDTALTLQVTFVVDGLPSDTTFAANPALFPRVT